MIYLLCGILFIILLFLSIRLLLIHKSIREICGGLSDILGAGTLDNTSTNAQSGHTSAQGGCNNAQ